MLLLPSPIGQHETLDKIDSLLANCGVERYNGSYISRRYLNLRNEVLGILGHERQLYLKAFRKERAKK